MKALPTKMITLMASFVFMACASSPNKTEVVEKTEVTTTRAAPQTPPERASVALDRNIVSAVTFEPGRKGLSPEATAELNRVIMEAKQRGEVESVDVAAWSDMSAQGKRVPTEQVRLARERAANIQKYIDRMEPEAEVQTHNMAQQPSSFARFLNTQDPSVKNRLAAVGVTTDSSGQKVHARNSSALVFIKLK